MSANELSNYQKSVISGYYDNLDTIMLQKLGELVTELYLADTEARRNRLWERAHKAMVKLKIPPAIIDHIMQKKDVQVLAKNLQDWLGGKRKDKTASDLYVSWKPQSVPQAKAAVNARPLPPPALSGDLAFAFDCLR